MIRASAAVGGISANDGDEMLAGLMAAQKYLPCKFFYDKTGSKLFEQITRLEEYYPSRTEKFILKKYAPALAKGPEATAFVEIGSGDCSKISILLQSLPRKTVEALTYIPLDVSESAIKECGWRLKKRFGDIAVYGIVADFTQQLNLVSPLDNRIFCFFGSTIGNLDRREAIAFVRRLGQMLKRGERLLLGLDMVKNIAVLENAYNDGKGVTAKFNKNILRVANKTIGSDFEPEYFRHRAFFNAKKQRIEMHLVAKRDMIVTSPLLDKGLEIREGETIHTENSHKFTFEQIDEIASQSGLSVRAVYTDRNRWFAVVDYIK